jgi:hypothetical protein
MASDLDASVVWKSNPDWSLNDQRVPVPRQYEKIDFNQTEAAANGLLSSDLLSRIESLKLKSKRTFAPDNDITEFKETLPTPNDLRSVLIGGGVANDVDWNNIKTTSSSEYVPLDATQTHLLASGSIVNFIMPMKANTASADLVAYLDAKIEVGAHCTLNGEVISGRLTIATEGEGDGDSNGSSGLLPSIQIPPLTSTQSSGSLDNFLPPQQTSYSSTSFHGSFDASSLINPDLQATGFNWVHSVTTTWTDSNTWSFSERLIVSFNLGNARTFSSEDEPSSNEVQGSSNGQEENSGEGQETGLEETSSWESAVGVSRSGYLFFSLDASRGITTPSAAGVLWSLDMRFLDSLFISGNAGGESTFIPKEPDNEAEGDGDSGGGGDARRTQGGNDSTGNSYPDDFNAQSEWSATFGVGFTSRGNFIVSSTPSVASDGGIQRAIDAGGDYSHEPKIMFSANWSSSSQSGDLSAPGLGVNCRCMEDGSAGAGNPLPPGGQLGMSFDDAKATDAASNPDAGDTFDPIGPLEGHGSASASSGGAAAQLAGGISGSWSLQGIMKGAQFESVVGDAFAMLEADLKNAAEDEHLWVASPSIPSVPNETGDGYTHYAISIAVGWDIDGEEIGKPKVDSDVNLEVDNEGNIVSHNSGSSASLKDDAKSVGFDFMNIVASKTIQRNVDRLWNSDDGVWTNDVEQNYKDITTIKYNSRNFGKAIGSEIAMVLGADESADSASLKTTINAHGTEILIISHTLQSNYNSKSSKTGYSIKDVGYTNTAQREFFVNKFTANGEISVTLNSDDSKTWTGNASYSVSSSVRYDQKLDQDQTETIEEVGHAPIVTPGTGIRRAIFFRKASLVGEFIPATGLFTNRTSRTGDTVVHLTGNPRHGTEWQKTPLENSLESIYKDSSSGYPIPPEETPSDALPPDYVYPSNPVETGLFAWFGGTAGDAGDNVLDFTAGVADSITPTSAATRYIVGALSGYDGANEDSTAYFVGEVSGTVVSVVIPAGGAAGAINKLTNKFDDLGRCKNLLTRLRHGMCFVAGTKVTLSDLPYSQTRESSVWSETDWLSNDNYSSSPSPRFREKESGDEGLELSCSRITTQTSSLLIPIEQVSLGSRVPTKNPHRWDYDFSLPEPNEETWKRFSLTALDDVGAIVEAEFIRPDWWIEENGITIGALIPFAMEELGLSGFATIQCIDDCTPIASGDGSVVTGRFTTNRVDIIVRITIAGPDGTKEILEGTTVHPIWSLDRNDWIPLNELLEGECLQAADGIATVLSVAIVNTNVPVYNIEVHGEHVYQVGELGLLVHNSCPTAPVSGGRGLWNLTKEGASKLMKHGDFGTFFKSKSDGLWWAVDNAGHGGSAFKVFKETGKGLEWIADADKFGDFIVGKHKGPTGLFILWKHLRGQ